MTKPNAKQIIEGKITDRLKTRPDMAGNIGATVAIELTGVGGGHWLIDCTGKTPSVKPGNLAKAAATISMETAVFEKVFRGEMDAQTAFLTGKVKVDGDLGLAIKLGQLLT